MFDFTKLVLEKSAPARTLSEFEGGYSVLSIALTYAAHLVALRNTVQRNDLGKQLDTIYGVIKQNRRKTLIDNELMEWEAAELQAMLTSIDKKAMPVLTKDLLKALQNIGAMQVLSEDEPEALLPENRFSASETLAILEATDFKNVILETSDRARRQARRGLKAQ